MKNRLSEKLFPLMDLFCFTSGRFTVLPRRPRRGFRSGPAYLAVITGALAGLLSSAVADTFKSASPIKREVGAGKTKCQRPEAAIDQTIPDLMIAEGTTLVVDFARLPRLTVIGSISNFGNLQICLPRGPIPGTVLRARTIFNGASGVITITSHDSLESSASFVLEAVDRILNQGKICSGGGLSVRAGDIANAGLIKSQAGNLNFAGRGKSPLQINNTGGKIEALAGWINVSDSAENESIDLELAGGDWLSQRLNLVSPGGAVQANVENVTGAVNASADRVDFLARSRELQLGSIQTAGDPLFFNKGNINIIGDIQVAEDLTILASGNITSAAALTSIKTQDANGQGHNIVIVAGANLSVGSGTGNGVVPGAPSSVPITLNFTSPPGGSIDLSASSGLVISSASTNQPVSGGGVGLAGSNIVLAAFANGAVGGQIKLATNSLIDASGADGVTSSAGAGGSIVILAGAASGTSAPRIATEARYAVPHRLQSR